MTGIDVATLEMMATAAEARAEMWRLAQEFASRPTAEFVEHLRDGSVIDRIERSTHWLGESFDIGDLIGALRAFRNRSARFTLEQDLAQLDAEWERLIADDAVVDICADEARQAIAEADAWRAGDSDAAKQGRAEQFRGFETRLEQIARWCQKVDDDAHHLVVQVLVRVVAAHVGVESGRDLLGRLETKNQKLTLDFG